MRPTSTLPRPVHPVRPARPARPRPKVMPPRPAEDTGARLGAGPTSEAPPEPARGLALPKVSVLVLAAVVVVAGLLGLLLLNTKINENAFELEDLRAKQAALDIQEQQLSRQLAERESPGSLAAAARRLGLVPAGTPAFVSLPDGRIVGVATPAGAGTQGTGTQGSGSAGSGTAGAQDR